MQEDDAEVLGFNRNIVECKASSEPAAVSLKTVLIETLWNVKEASGGQEQ